MRAIYKFDMLAKKLGSLVKLDLPAGAKPLSVHAQTLRGAGLFAGESETLCMWVEGNFPSPDDAYAYTPSETRTFLVAGTGHALPESADLNFIGTALMDQDRLVLHVFEVLP